MSALNEEQQALAAEIDTTENALSTEQQAEAGVQRQATELRTQAKDAAGRGRAWHAKVRALRLHEIEDEDESPSSEAAPAPAAMDSEDVDMKPVLDGEGNPVPDETHEASQSIEESQTSTQAKHSSSKLQTYSEEQLMGES